MTQTTTCQPLCCIFTVFSLLLNTIRDRFNITYDRYKFTTYTREYQYDAFDPNVHRHRSPANTPNPKHTNGFTNRSISFNTIKHRLTAVPKQLPTSSPSASSVEAPIPSIKPMKLSNRMMNKNEQNLSDLTAERYDTAHSDESSPLQLDNRDSKDSRNSDDSKDSEPQPPPTLIQFGYTPINHKVPFSDWIIGVKIVVQRKCLDFLLDWIEHYWIEDFDGNEAMIETLTDFIAEMKRSRDQFESKYSTKSKAPSSKTPSQSLITKEHHSMYACFLQNYILKFNNIVARQQSWYNPIVQQLREHQEQQQNLLTQQIQISKMFRTNRLNSQRPEPNHTRNGTAGTVNNLSVADDGHIRNRSATASVSAFSDNIFGVSGLANLNLFDSMESERGVAPSECDTVVIVDDGRSDVDGANEHRGHETNQSGHQSMPSGSSTISISTVTQNLVIPSPSAASTAASTVTSIGTSFNGPSPETPHMTSTLSFIKMKNQENANEYAKQLTLLDWECFIAIDARICLYKIKRKKKTEKWMPLKLFIDRFNQINRFVTVSIIGAPDLKARIEMIEFFVFVAEKCLKLNNLYSFMAICTALDSPSIQKLSISWEFVNRSVKRKFTDFLAPMCSSERNYQKLRSYCESMKPPAIPFLGVILKDLVFANDGNKERLPLRLGRQLNFDKYRMFHRILSENITAFHVRSYSETLTHSKQFQSGDINALQSRLRSLTAMSQQSSLERNGFSAFTPSKQEDNGSGSGSGSQSKSSEDTRESVEMKEDSPESVDLIERARVKIIPDLELQQEMLKDLNTFILLKKSAIKALTMEANRIDAKKKDEYIEQYVMPTLTKPKSANVTRSRSNTPRSSFFTRASSVTAVQQVTEKKSGMSVLKKLLNAATLPKIKDQSPAASPRAAK